MHLASQGRFPHRSLSWVPVHVVYRLANSVPVAARHTLQENYQNDLQALQRRFPQRTTAVQQELDYHTAAQALRNRYFQQYDQLLDQLAGGPTWLSQPEIALLVYQSWMTVAEQEAVGILALCIMPNHVHILLRSQQNQPLALGKLIGSHKKYTARRANTLLQRTGDFWAADFFDRDVRPGALSTVVQYILYNPVRARLVSDWQAWPHTYLHPDLRGEEE